MSNFVSVGKTDFPLRPDPALRGPLPLGAPAPGSSFRLLDGPPYANGLPHLGHVLNKHLKDAVARAAHAQGHALDWRPGWDCHGLPLELAVERQGVSRADREGFVAAARAFASSQASAQSQVFQQQGWCAQWDSPWHTQDPAMEAGTLRVLARLLDRRLLDVEFTAVPWCAQCQSTVSNAEQEDRTLVVQTWLVPFFLHGGDALLSWTTTPWTLPLHQHLVVNPDAHYVRLVGADGSGAWVSEDSAADWAARLAATLDGQRCLGSVLAGQAYRSPWMEGVVKADPAVLPAAGTGVLHAVPGLSELDTQLGRGHGWEVHPWLTADGRVQGSPLPQQNQLSAGSEASEVVRPHYAASSWFLAMEQSQEVAHCWRHGVPLLTRASRQVFLRLDEQVRARAASMVEQMDFSPASARTRLLAAMRDRPAWCLSRQRTWGVPMALFLDRQTGQPHALASEFMKRVADAVEQDGVEAWWSSPSSRWLAGVDEASVERVDDVLDVWFDSGCVPQLVGQADVVVEGVDQHRGWFQSCVWLAAALDAEMPFKRVACHGFVVDQSGEKLSKSKGGDRQTQVAPWHELTTDVVRVWALSGTDGNDKAWTQETVQMARGWMDRWRGVVRFMLANVLPEEGVVSSADLPAWDRYWVVRCNEAATQVVAHAARAEFGDAVGVLAQFGEQFSSLALGSWKDRLYCAPAHTPERQHLDLVVRACLHAWGRMLGVLAPRLHAEAQSFWPMMHDFPCLTVSASERAEVEFVLSVRQALSPRAEAMNKERKGGSGLRCASAWVGAPAWPGQLLADALDVGLLLPADSLPAHALVVDGQRVGMGLEWATQERCPRCRRVQPAWQGEWCQACQDRLA